MMQRILPLLLRPVVTLCLRHSVRLSELVEMLKAVYVEACSEQLENEKAAVSASRISVMSGVHRKDVARLLGAEPITRPSKSIATRVIGAWRNSKRYCGASGKPRVLSVEGKKSEFVDLVHSVSSDVNPYTILFELERIGALSRSPHGVKLTSRLFNPGSDHAEGLNLLAADVGDLMEAVQENIESDSNAVPNLHIKTEYDNIPAQHAPTIREWCLKEGSAFHQRIRNYLSQFDRDLNPAQAGSGGTIRVAVGAFSRIEPIRKEGKV